MDALFPKGSVPRGGAKRRQQPLLQCDALEDRRLLSAGGFWLSHAALGQGRPALVMAGHHMSLPRGGRLMLMRHGLGMINPGGPMLVAPTQAPSTGAGVTTIQANPQIQTVATTIDTTQTATPSTTTTSNDSTSQSTTTSTSPTTIPAVNSLAPLQTPQAPNPQVSADLQKLQTDRHAILAKSQVTIAELVAIHDDLQAIDKAATFAPSTSALQAFQNDLKAIQGTLPTDAQKSQLEADFTALVKSRGVTDDTLISKTISDAEAIVASSNVTADDLSTIAADQKALQTDLAASMPSNAPGGDMGDPMSLGGLLSGGLNEESGGGKAVFLNRDGAMASGPIMLARGDSMTGGSMMGGSMMGGSMMGGPMMFKNQFFGKGGHALGGMGGLFGPGMF